MLRRPGHTEAAVDLARLAGLPEAGVLAEVVNDDGTMARLPELRDVRERPWPGPDLHRAARRVPPAHRTPAHPRGADQAAERLRPWQAFGYRHEIDGTEYLALVLGDVADGADVLTRLHSECLTGDVFGSLRCDCGAQLEAAMAAIAAEGRGVVLYLRGHEGRGVGLLSKLRAYELQDARRGHGGRQPGARPARRRPRVLGGRADAGRPGRALGPPAHQQPGQGQRPDRLRRGHHRPDRAPGRRHPVQPAVPDHQARQARPPDSESQ